MENLLSRFIDDLTLKNKTKNTIEAYSRDIKKYIDYVKDENLMDIDYVTIMAYTQELKKEGKSNSTINRNVIAIKSFYKYLIKNNVLDRNPFDRYDMVKVKRDIPDILTVEEVDKLLSIPDISTDKGIRDKTMLEVLYATGMKVSELLKISIDDINFRYAYIKCRGSKEKERIIPLGSYAIKSLEQYIKIRGNFTPSNNNYLFLNNKGQLMTRQGFWKIIKYYSKEANINKEINNNTLRHSFAVHLLQNGADIKSVQEMLGHSGMAVTQIYAGIVRKTKLAEVYKNAHPRA